MSKARGRNRKRTLEGKEGEEGDGLAGVNGMGDGGVGSSRRGGNGAGRPKKGKEGKGKGQGKGKKFNRAARKEEGKETIRIAKEGRVNGVDIAAECTYPEQNRVLYVPGDDVVAEWDALRETRQVFETSISVTSESSMEAARRLDDLLRDEGWNVQEDENEEERPPSVCVLSFASAKNPGGGVLTGSKAQEEDLCRQTALYRALLGAPGYAINKKKDGRGMYTDHMVYAPVVPVFRNADGSLIRSREELRLVSFVSSAAVNAGRLSKNRQGEVLEALERRANRILAAMALHGHTHIVLGAWGTGVFKNDPTTIAEIFADALDSPRFSGVFSHVCFAVLSNPNRSDRTRSAFEAVFP